MADEAVNVVIVAKDEASSVFKSIGASAEGLGSILKRAAGIAAGAFSVAAIINFGRSSLAAYGESEKATMKLKNALEGLGASSKSTLGDLQAFSKQIQAVTTVSNTTAVGLMSVGVNLGKMSGDTLKAATVAAIGFSKSMGMDVKTAMLLVSKAANGNTEAFRRYGVVLPESMSQADKFTAILEKGAQGFKLATAEADTYAGATDQLGNAWGDVKESTGQAIAQIPGLITGIKFAKAVIENFGAIMRITGDSIVLGVIVFVNDIKHQFTVVMPQIFGWLKDNWKNMLKDLLNMYVAFAINLSSNLQNLGKAIISWMKGDGFKFEWTPLLDGFEAATEKFPEIAKRSLTEVEVALATELEKSKEALGASFKAGMKPKEIDTKALVAGAEFTGKGDKVEKKSDLKAVESRFLVGATGPDYVKATSENTKRTNLLLERMVKRLELLATRAAGREERSKETAFA